MDSTDCSSIVVLDELVLRHGGMLVANGHSLYKSRDTIMECLAQIMDDCKHTPRSLITIADVGTADGSTSLSLFNEIIGSAEPTQKEIVGFSILAEDLIDKVRIHTGESHKVMIYYTDLPANDFNRMFSVINDLQSGLNLGPDVFCAAVGRTMYEQCLPDTSTDLIFSSVAAMILSKSPCRIHDGLYPTEKNSEEMETFNRQSASDWKTFLIMRGRELRPGGYLVVLSIGTTKQGEITVDIKGGIATLSHTLRTLVADDLISKDELLDCNFTAVQHRKEEDYVLPFKENDVDLAKTGLELVSVRSFVNKLDHPSFDVSNKDDATQKVYADRIVAGIKPWLYGTIYNGLSCSRSRQERQNLVEIYFSRLWDFAYKNNDQTPQLGLIEVVARKRL